MNDESDPVVELLTEIRDLQREHLAEYKRVTTRSLELSEQAIRTQASSVAKQKIGLLVLAGMLAALALSLYAGSGR